MLQTVRAGKAVGENGVICLVFMLSSMLLRVIESRQLEVTKNIYLLCPGWCQKKVSAHGHVGNQSIEKHFEISTSRKSAKQPEKSIKVKNR